MSIFKIISKHLNKDNIKIPIYHNINSICAITGENITCGVLKKDLIKSTFTDHQYLRYHSDYVSLEVALTIENWEGRVGLRSYSFIATENNLTFLDRSEILKYVVKPPENSFIFCVTFSHKKHIAFKSKLNSNSEKFTITTDLGDVFIDLKDDMNLIKTINDWYTIIKGQEDKKQPQTYFTKQNILGETEPIQERILLYGINRFINQDKFLNKYRNTLKLKLLTHILNANRI